MTEGMSGAVTSAFGSVKTDVFDMITAVLPYGLGILGVGLAITLAIKFFKKIANK